MKRVIAIIISALLLLSFAAGCTPKSFPNDPPSSGSPSGPGADGQEPDDDHPVTSLRVNYEKNPFCVEGAPLFSWAINTEERGLKQKSYQIRVAASEADLKAGSSLIWDSGTVESGNNVAVIYGGDTQQLKDATRYWWSVSVTTEKGEMLDSGISHFTTAIKADDLGGAKWITAAENRSLSFNGANWIWLLTGDSQGNVPVKTEYFRKSFNIEKEIKTAIVCYTADDFGDVYVNGNLVMSNSEENGWEHAKFVDAANFFKQGRNVVAASAVNKQHGYGACIVSIIIEYKDGSSDRIVSDRTWVATDSASNDWFDPDASESSFKKVNSVIKYGETPWNNNVSITDYDSSAPLFRKSVNIGTGVKSAFLFASAAGLYQAYVNGESVDNSVLNPGRSEYTQRIMYQCFDVTKLLKEGENVIGAMLGRGWYIGAYSPYGGTSPAFIATLIIDYEDGRREQIITDESWSCCDNGGPILYNDIFNGEVCDGNFPEAGWCSAGGSSRNTAAWKQAVSTDAAKLGVGKLVPQLSGLVRAMDKIAAKSVTKIDEKTYIYDFGQNLAGVASVDLKGSKGTVVTLRHAEMLNDGSKGSDGPKGTLYTENLRSAKATDTYIMRGDPDGENYTPTFTFHGFRYIELSGLSEAPALSDVNAIVLYSDLEDSGWLSTSDELVNQLISNTYWGQRGNFLSTPTDCPQRDERMGWSGDAQIFCGTAAYNMNVKAFFDKYITDLNDCQRSDGSYPDVAPQTWRQNYTGSGNNAWGDAGVIIPWIMYERYGDISYIEKYYKNMKKYESYLVSTSDNYIRSRSAYGDWLSIGETTDKGVTDTAYCIRVCDILTKMARLLGQDKDAERFASHAAKYREAWIGKYVRNEKRLKSDTQTSYLVALAFDILPEDMRQAMADRLNDKIIKNGTKLTTGFIGCSLLLPVLCRFGHSDTAFGLLQQEEYPSWKYPILQGATTIWERWNSYTLADGFGDAAMNSFNHYSYGSVTEWLYSMLSGIGCDENAPAFSHIILNPTAGGNITFVKGAYESVRGMIKSSWEAVDNIIVKYECTVPGNTSATLYLRAESLTAVTESGVPLEEAEGINVVSFDNGLLTLELGSGVYNFEIGK